MKRVDSKSQFRRYDYEFERDEVPSPSSAEEGIKIVIDEPREPLNDKLKRKEKDKE